MRVVVVMVKRYDLVHIDLGYDDEWYEIEECDGGGYVTYDDYAALRALCDELAKECEEMSDEFMIEFGLRRGSHVLVKYDRFEKGEA